MRDRNRGGIVPPAQPMEIYRLSPPAADGSRAVGTIAFCTRDDIKAATAISWKRGDYSFLAANEYISEFIITGNLLTMQRNECIKQMDGDWILFIDDDMTWQPQAIRQIVETQRRTGAEVVGGLCFQRTPPHQPTLYMSNADHTGYAFEEKWNDGEILDVDATGLAFCLITTAALTKIIHHETGDKSIVWPSLEERKRIPGWRFFQWDGRWGEDFQFCRAAKSAGCRIVVDTGIEIGHVADIVVTKKDFLKEVFFRHEAVENAKRESVKDLGVDVLSRAEALVLLEKMMEDEARR
jgi:glycosyltransferase involved in cell wall biosynthesis